MRSTDFFACLELLPGPALVVDGDERIVFANTYAARLLEQPELLGMPLAEVVAGGTQHDHGPAVSRRQLWLDGQLRSVVLLHHAEGPADCARASAGQPSTLALQEALQKNEERLRHATAASHVGLFDHAMTPDPPPPPFWSETLRALLGYPQEQEADFDWFRARLHPDDGPLLDAAIARVMRGEGDGRIDLVYRWRHPEHGWRWLMNRSDTFHEEHGGRRIPVRTLGAILDVTERRAAEEAEALRAAILDASPDLVAISRLDGSLVFLNRAARSFLGLGAHDPLAGASLERALPVAVIRLLDEVANPTAKARGSWSGETELIRHDGAIVPMSHVVLAHRDSTGEIAYLCTIARDLSRERRLEEQFRQAQKMEAIGRLAGGVAHDFNNLLSVILGYAELAEQELQQAFEPGSPASEALAAARGSLGEIARAGERAAALTGQLLAFGRRQILKPRVVDVNDVLAEFTPMVSRLLDERIKLHVTPSSTKANIRADPTQVLQVLLNLVVNARDAMPDGGALTIEAFRAQIEENQAATKLDLRAGVYVVIAVSDTGHGMDATTKSRIFEPFFTTKRAGEGSGLGLSTVFGIVQQSGGGIWVYSEVDRGTTFKIYLPCTEDTPTQAPPPPTSVEAHHGGVILVSEDDEQVRSMMTNVLMRAGYVVLAAADAAEALTLAERHPGRIDLLLTDVVMPGKTGAELAEALHALRPEVPVLFTSGYTENTIVHRGVLDDAVNFLPKPLTPGRLLSAIAEALSLSRIAQPR